MGYIFNVLRTIQLEFNIQLNFMVMIMLMCLYLINILISKRLQMYKSKNELSK